MSLDLREGFVLVKHFLESSRDEENSDFGETIGEFYSMKSEKNQGRSFHNTSSKGRTEEGSTLLWSECLCPSKFKC